jgi:hypothetical protein
MRLKQYINEVKSYTFEGITNFLRLDCKPFLKEMRRSSRLLYRGVDRNIPDIQRIKSHIDTGRSPKDMPEEMHNALNDMFYKEFGWHVRDGVSTSGSVKTAKHYGVPHIFFPIGKYKYAWSQDVGDLYSRIEDYGYHLEFDPSEAEDEWEYEYSESSGSGWYEYDGEGQYGSIEEIEDELEDDEEDFDTTLVGWVPEIELEDYVEKKEDEWEDSKQSLMNDIMYGYKYMFLNPQGIKSRSEVMFNCKTYYLINMRWEKQLIDMLMGR